MDLRGKTVVARCTWTGVRFEPNLAVLVGDDGRIQAVSPADTDTTAQSPRRFDLPHHALMPGFVNAHSHAFQRALRALPQRFESGRSDFWTWRQSMYRLVESLDADRFYEHSRRAFTEMLAAGITAVGEFHYLHHPHEPPGGHWAMDDALLAAARDAGIRLCLLQTYYATGNVGCPLAGAQQQFGPLSRDEFVRQLDRLAGKLDAATQSLALACHSIRAVEPRDMKYFRDLAIRNDWPFHVHVEEVRREIEDCRAAYGVGPLALLLRELPIDARVTAIHCTHSTQADLREFVARGGRICLCPITEGNLSDGFPDVPFIRQQGGQISFGTDSNIRISATEELRWLELGQRARHETRGIVVDELGSSAAALLQVGTANGAAALAIPAGAIRPGSHADFIAIDLQHPALSGSADSSLADALVFGCGNEPIAGVWVGGIERRRVSAGSYR